MVPVLVATCTTNIVLAPVALMPGMGGFLFRPLAMAVAFAMFASFLLSRTFVPMMCASSCPTTTAASGAPVLPPSTDAAAEHDEHDPGWFGRIHQRIDGFLDSADARRISACWPLALRHRFPVLTHGGHAVRRLAVL